MEFAPKEIVSTIFFCLFFAVLVFILLNEKKYRTLSNHAQSILRVLGSIGAAFAAPLITGTLQVDLAFGEEMTLNAAGGFGLFVLVFWFWSRHDKAANEEQVRELVASGIEQKTTEVLAEQLVSSTGGQWFGEHVNKQYLQDAVHKIAVAAQSGQAKAGEILRRLNVSPNIAALREYFETVGGEEATKARLYYAARDMPKAQAAVTSALARTPADPELKLLEASISEHLGNPDKAKQSISEALENIDPTEGLEAQELLGDARSFMAHLVGQDGGEQAADLLKLAYGDYAAAGNTSKQASVAMRMEDKEKLTQLLSGHVDDEGIKAALYRKSAELNAKSEEPDLRELALAEYRSALKLDEKIQYEQCICEDHQGLAELFSKRREFRAAERHAHQAIEHGERSHCWKVVRGSYLILADVKMEQGNITEMKEMRDKAAEISRRFHDPDGADVIDEYNEHKEFVSMGEHLGLYKEDSEVDRDTVDLLAKATDRFGTDRIAERLEALRVRKELFTVAEGGPSALGLSGEESEALIEKLGFTNDPLDVDLDAFVDFMKDVRAKLVGLKEEDLVQMAGVRRIALDQMDQATDRQGGFILLANFIRMGFSLDDPLSRDLKKFKREFNRITTMQGDKSDLISQGIAAWASALSILVDDATTEEEKNAARTVLEILGADDNPESVTLAGSKAFVAKLEELA